MRRDVGALEGREFDLAVVGGGIQGACVARDAALRGLSVALLERDDFGAATSGNSLGIVHGGFRYLQQADLVRLRASATERAAWLRTAPHLVRPLPVLVPTYRGRRPGRGMLAAALVANDLLTAGRNRRAPPGRRVPRGRILSRIEALELAPWLEPAGLTGAALFHDARMLLPDRLTFAVVLGAAEAGAVVANRVEATQLLLRQGRVAGLRAHDGVSGGTLVVRARLVVDAAGPWAGRLAPSASAAAAPALLEAMNVVVARPLVPRGCAVAIGGGAGRLHFVAPWQDRAAVGTAYWPPVGPGAAGEAVPRFLAELGPAFGGRPLVEGEVTRVLHGRLPADRPEGPPSTRARVIDHGRAGGPEGLLSVVGVKYTTARLLAERVVGLAVARLGRAVAPPRTAEAPLPGGEGGDPDRLADEAATLLPAGLSPGGVRRLVELRGARWREVLPAAPAARLVPGVPILEGELLHAAREEMAGTLEDVLVRRTGIAAAGLPGEATLAACAALVGAALGWDATRTAREVAALRVSLEGWRAPGPAPAASSSGPRR